MVWRRNGALIARVAFAHFFGLVAHVFVDDALVDTFGSQIGGVGVAEDVVASDDAPLGVA